jgi:hypothetical protein
MTSVRSTKRATLSGNARAFVRQPLGRYIAILVDGTRATDWVLDCRRITSSGHRAAPLPFAGLMAAPRR